MKSRVITIFLMFVMLLAVPTINANEDGIINKSVNGCTCHGGGEGNAEVVIDLPEEYSPGQTYSLDITVTSGGFTSGGFNLATSAGSLSTNDPNTKFNRDKLCILMQIQILGRLIGWRLRKVLER